MPKALTDKSGNEGGLGLEWASVWKRRADVAFHAVWAFSSLSVSKMQSPSLGLKYEVKRKRPLFSLCPNPQTEPPRMAGAFICVHGLLKTVLLGGCKILLLMRCVSNSSDHWRSPNPSTQSSIMPVHKCCIICHSTFFGEIKSITYFNHKYDNLL